MNRREFVRKNLIAGAALSLPACSLAQGAESAGADAQPADPSNLLPEYFGRVDLAPPGSLLQAGFSERDITPKVGMQMAGDYVPAFVKGVHDPCKVRAVVFGDGRNRVALVGLDTLVAPDSVVRAARQKIQARFSIAAESVMIGAAHNHSSGPVGMVMPGEFDGAPDVVRRLAYEESQVADQGYLDHITEQIVGAVGDANARRVDAYCGIGSGTEDKVGFRRQFHMKNGLTYSHPGQGNPDIAKPAGAVDPQVGVIGVWGTGGAFLGCVVNYTCHATTNPGTGEEASANWIYYMERVIRGAMGADVPVVFLQGAAGNITQVDNLSPYRYPDNTPWAEYTGGRIGAEVVKTLLSVVPGKAGPLQAKSTVLEIPRRAPSPGHVREAFETLKKGKEAYPNLAPWVFAKETVLLDYKLKSSKTVAVEIQAIQIGAAVFVSNPAELFCQAGLDIKAASGFPLTCVVSYANGSVGYVPTEDDLGPHGGGYEARLTSYTNLAPTAAGQIVKASVSLLGELHPGALAMPELHAPFTRTPEHPNGLGPNAWGYGAVPPELD